MYVCNYKETKIFIKLNNLMSTNFLGTTVESKQIRTLYLATNFNFIKENNR